MPLATLSQTQHYLNWCQSVIACLVQDCPHVRGLDWLQASFSDILLPGWRFKEVIQKLRCQGFVWWNPDLTSTVSILRCPASSNIVMTCHDHNHPRVSRRILREIAILSKLEHENIAWEPSNALLQPLEVAHGQKKGTKKSIPKKDEKSNPECSRSKNDLK